MAQQRKPKQKAAAKPEAEAGTAPEKKAEKAAPKKRYFKITMFFKGYGKVPVGTECTPELEAAYVQSQKFVTSQTDSLTPIDEFLTYTDVRAQREAAKQRARSNRIAPN